VSACGPSSAPPQTLAYDLWAGGASAVPAADENGAQTDGENPASPDGTNFSVQTGSDQTAVAGETVERGGAPILQVSVNALDFGETAALLTFQVYNAGGGTLEYTIAADQAWVSVNPDAGANAGAYDAINVGVDRSGLQPGSYTSLLTVASADGQAQQVSVSVAVPSTPPPSSAPDEPPPDVPSAPARAAYFFWDWNTDEAQIDAFVPRLAGHYQSACVVFIGQADRVQANLEHVLSIPHPPELIVGLTTSDMLDSLEDVDGWKALGSLAAWCAARTGVPRIGLDVEWDIDGYLYHDIPLDFAKYEEGLREFATYIPGVQVYFYPPNWEGGIDETTLQTVQQRTRVIESAQTYLPNFHAMGASLSTYGSYWYNPNGAAYRALEASWSVPPGSVEQIFVIDDTWWVPDTLRPILPTIPRECWIYLEPPYNADKADRLIRCLEPPGN
jgi:hypothetical protein